MQRPCVCLSFYLFIFPFFSNFLFVSSSFFLFIFSSFSNFIILLIFWSSGFLIFLSANFPYFPISLSSYLDRRYDCFRGWVKNIFSEEYIQWSISSQKTLG